jgi:hypothetical protein
MEISDAAAQSRYQHAPRQGNGPVSDPSRPAPQVTLQCTPTRNGDELVFPYTVANDGPGDVYVADAFHRVDPVTHVPSADPDIISIEMQPDNFAMILRGNPRRPPFPVARAIQPLMRRLGPGQKLERQLSVPLPLAETTPYEPYSNVRDYTLKPIDGVVLAVDWMPAATPDLLATPAVGAEGYFTISAPNYLRDMQRLTSRFPTRGLSILERVRK